jgi:hypothetical protein
MALLPQVESGITPTVAERSVSTVLPTSLVLPQPLMSAELPGSQRAPSSVPAILMGVWPDADERTR